jgi:hypothetical protein
MDVTQGNAAYDPSLPSQTLSLVIGGRALELEFTSALCGPASSSSGLDLWVVRIATIPAAGPVGPAETVTYKIGTLGRDRGPDPLGVLKAVASDLALAIQLPRDTGKAANFLFDEGHAERPSDALAMVQALRTARAVATCILIGTGIGLDTFARHVDAMPYAPRCSLPVAGHHAMGDA